MNKLVFGFAAIVPTLLAAQVHTADFVEPEYGPPPVAVAPAPPVIEHRRTVCDQFGRCWRESRALRPVVETYDYALRPPLPVGPPVYAQPIDQPALPAPPYYAAPAPRVYAPAEFGADDDRW